MKSPTNPANEAARLAALQGYEILDTGPDVALDALTKLAAGILNVPIALISLVDADRQWFKSRHGLDASQTSREISFCGHVVAEGASLIVGDALTDARFADNPLVTGDPGIRFYAGAPLRTAAGFTLGTVCAIDRVPRDITKKQMEMLSMIAGLVVDRFETQRALAIRHRVVDAVRGMLAYWDRNQQCLFANRAYEGWFGVSPHQLIGKTLRELLGSLYPLNLPYIEGALRGEVQAFEREIPDPTGAAERSKYPSILRATSYGRRRRSYVPS